MAVLEHLKFITDLGFKLEQESETNMLFVDEQNIQVTIDLHMNQYSFHKGELVSETYEQVFDKDYFELKLTDFKVDVLSKEVGCKAV